MQQLDLTAILSRLPSGGRDAFDDLLGAAYQELRRLARGHLRRERDGHTLSATGLVHEAWMRLAGQRSQSFESRAHFFGAASRAMRRVLVDYARGHSAQKRHVERAGTTAAIELASGMTPCDELLAIDDALDRLAAINPRYVRVVECRYFAGLTITETADAIRVSHATVSDDWRFARAWLHRALSPSLERQQVAC